MERPNPHLLILLSISLLFGCEGLNSFNSEEELLHHISHHHSYQQTHEVGETLVKATRLPTDLLVANEINGKPISLKEVEEKRGVYNEFLYFRISLAANGQNWLKQASTDFQAYSHLLKTLSFRMGEYLYLSVGKEKLAPADVFYERDYNLSATTQLLVAFPRDEIPRTGKPIELNLQEFGGNLGHLRFHFPNELKREPTINFKERLEP